MYGTSLSEYDAVGSRWRGERSWNAMNIVFVASLPFGFGLLSQPAINAAMPQHHALPPHPTAHGACSFLYSSADKPFFVGGRGGGGGGGWGGGAGGGGGGGGVGGTR